MNTSEQDHGAPRQRLGLVAHHGVSSTPDPFSFAHYREMGSPDVLCGSMMLGDVQTSDKRQVTCYPCQQAVLDGNLTREQPSPVHFVVLATGHALCGFDAPGSPVTPYLSLTNCSGCLEILQERANPGGLDVCINGAIHEPHFDCPGVGPLFEVDEEPSDPDDGDARISLSLFVDFETTSGVLFKKAFHVAAYPSYDGWETLRRMIEGIAADANKWVSDQDPT